MIELKVKKNNKDELEIAASPKVSSNIDKINTYNFGVRRFTEINVFWFHNKISKGVDQTIHILF